MLLYYITDRHQFEGNEQAKRRELLLRIAQAARAGVDYIQLREKDLTTQELELLARDAVQCVHDNSAQRGGTRTRLLINSRTDVAIATGADGVHLTSIDISPADARALVAASAKDAHARDFIVSASCHTLESVRLAESQGADFVVFSPIFEKKGTNRLPIGLVTLGGAAGLLKPIDRRLEAGDNRNRLPVFALGGVTLENAFSCVQAGAVGVAGIRLFQDGDLTQSVNQLRAMN